MMSKDSPAAMRKGRTRIAVKQDVTHKNGVPKGYQQPTQMTRGRKKGH